MQKLIRLTALALCSVMMLLTVACSGGTASPTPSPEPTSAPEPTPAPTPDPNAPGLNHYGKYSPDKSADMIAFKEAPEADSGEKGELFYADLPAVLSEFKDNTKLQYDTAKLFASVQGIVNREKPAFFIEFHRGIDDFWFNFLRQKDKLLYGYKIRRINTFDEFLSAFGDTLRKNGMVLWDFNVPSTANAASIVCGIDGYFPVRADDADDSLQKRLEAAGVPVKMDLSGIFTGKGKIPGTDRDSSGSVKCDPYLWALEKYGDRTSTEHMGYIPDGGSWEKDRVHYPDLDSALVYNNDYVIAEKAFIFDLSPWGDETPVDDPTQPMGTDLATLKEILLRHYQRHGGKNIMQIHGFPPWHIKYTTYKNGGSHDNTEWQYVEIISAYNCVMDADAAGYCGMLNASIYRLYPLKDHYENSTPPKFEFDQDKTYIYIYQGDYDSAAWLSRFVPRWWNDPARGSIPISWAFNPNLSERAPMVFDYIYEHKTENDFFISGDSGAGYLNPTLLFEPRKHSDLPDADEVWIAFNRKYFEQFDLSVTGFVINGNVPTDERTIEMYAKFSTSGTIFNNLPGSVKDRTIVNGMGVKHMDRDVASEFSDSHKMARQILSHIYTGRKGPKFYAFRTILDSPTMVAAAMKECTEKDDKIIFVDAYTFFDLMRQKAALDAAAEK